MTKPVSSRPKVCKRMFLVIICILFMTNIFAQVGISTTSITPDPTSILELRSTTLGFLAPRMTTTQRDAITSPATGLLIYNTTTNQLNYYSGSAWQVVTGGGQSQLNGTGFVKASGTTISYDNSTYLTSALTSFSKTDNYGITSSVTNSTTTPTHTIGVDTTLISSRLWRQKGIDSLSAIIATKGTGTVTSVTSATTDATVATTTTTPVITIVSAPKLTTARTIQGVSFDGTANINPVNGTGFVKASGATLSYDNSTYLTTAVTSFSKTDNYGITSSLTNPTTTPTHTIGIDTTLISSRLWRQKGIDSLSAIIATKGTGTVTSVTSATTDATVATTTTTPVITIVSAPKLTTARTIQGVSFDGTANINPVNGTGFVKSSGTTLSYDNSTYLTTAVTSFSKTDNYGITSSLTNPTTTPSYTIGVDTTLISSRLWRQKGIDSLSAIIATKGTGTVTSVTSATGDATITNTTTTPAITIISAPKLTTSRTIQGVLFDGTANINPINGTGFVKATGTTLSYDNSTYLTTAVTSFSKIDNYGITSSLTNPITTPTHTIGVDTTLISSRLWRQKGIDSLSAIIATKGTGTVTSVTSADANAAIVTTTTTPLITIVSAPKLQTARTINGVFFDGSANITVPSGNLTGDVTSVGNATTLSTVNSNVGTFNSITVNAKGLVTAATITTSELTGKTNADVNSTYPDNSTYFTNVTTANGFPANGNLNGVRKGTVNTQRMQDQLNGSTYERVWIEGTTSWTPWGLYLNTKDFTAKGQMQIASGNNAVGILSVGTDGQVLTADAASINGVKWGAVTGTGNVVLATSPTLVTPILGVASSTSQTINGTAGAGFVELQTQSSNPPTGAANSIRLFSNSLGQYSWIKASDGFSRSLNSVLTANRTFILPDASGTIPVSASGNIALSAAGNISFTGILPVANGGTNSSTTLNNNRIMVSSANTITEAAALTNGQLLIGSTGAAPVVANLTAGNGITITNAAGAITIADNPIISQATATADITTTSTTDVILAGMTITPGAGDYLVFFTGSMENSTSNQQGPVSIYSNGVQIAASVMRAINSANKAVSVATNAYITGLGAGQGIDIRWNVLSGTGTFHQRTLIVQKVK